MTMKTTLLVLLLFLAACHGEDKSKCKDRIYRGNPIHSPVTQLPFLDKPEIPHDQSLPAVTVTDLNASIESIMTSTDLTGITASVGVPGQGVWTYTGGVINRDSQIPVTESTFFWWMSIGKIFTATIIFQLIEEGKLTLDTSIAPWFPEPKYANSITIDDLLKHTSGLYSFQEDKRIINLERYLPPDELLSIAFSHPPLFCPNQYWGYSNTGYVMLAKIIESITGETYANAVQSRILQPLGMSNTMALEATIPGNIAYGHNEAKLPAPHFFPNLPFGAGNIISTSYDMVIFLQAYLHGDLFSNTTLHTALLELYPMYENGLYYGRGVMLFDIKNDNVELLWIGHTGGSQNTNAVIALDVNSGIIVTASVNDKTPTTAIAVKLFETIKAADL